MGGWRARRAKGGTGGSRVTRPRGLGGIIGIQGKRVKTANGVAGKRHKRGDDDQGNFPQRLLQVTVILNLTTRGFLQAGFSPCTRKIGEQKIKLFSA